MFYKFPIIPITNPNPVYTHTSNNIMETINLQNSFVLVYSDNGQRPIKWFVAINQNFVRYI
jgi:hypothetical protein